MAADSQPLADLTGDPEHLPRRPTPRPRGDVGGSAAAERRTGHRRQEQSAIVPGPTEPTAGAAEQRQEKLAEALHESSWRVPHAITAPNGRQLLAPSPPPRLPLPSPPVGPGGANQRAE